MTTARAKTRAVAATTDRISSPSRKCRCQSSGRVSVSVVAVIENFYNETIIASLGVGPVALCRRLQTAAVAGPGDSPAIPLPRWLANRHWRYNLWFHPVGFAPADS